MPAMQAVSSLVEFAINTAFGLARNTDALMQALTGKCCTLHLQEVELTFSLHFSIPEFSSPTLSTSDSFSSKTQESQTIIRTAKKYVDVTVDESWSDEQKHNIAENQAYISISIHALPELKQTSQLTRLIKQGKLDFYGDLYLVQKLSALFNDLDIDLAEILSQYIGDVPTHWIFSFANSTKDKAHQHHQSIMQTLSDAALEEKPIAVRPIMLMNFFDEIKALQAGVDRVAARIERLEKGVN